MRILIHDEDEPARRAMRRALAAEELPVEMFTKFDEMLEFGEMGPPPDLFVFGRKLKTELVDYGHDVKPENDGEDDRLKAAVTTVRDKARFADTPIFIMSNVAATAGMQKFCKDNNVQWLVKLAPHGVLVRAVRELLPKAA